MRRCIERFGERFAAALTLVLVAVDAHGVSFSLDGRFKAFGSDAYLPDGDAQREADGSPVLDGGVDLRLMLKGEEGPFHLIADLSTIDVGGDSFAFGRAPGRTLDQTPRDDNGRFMDLTWTLTDGDRYRAYQRFDRLAVEYRAEDFGITVGRQAVTWGSGIVFQPLDLFAPFAPTTVDRDYKPGEDVILFDHLIGEGDDLQVLGVFRRDLEGHREASEDSFGAKWHVVAGERELDFVVGRHYEDGVFGGGLHAPIGGALFRTDVLATDLHDGSWVFSGVANVDYSLTLAGRNTYVFAEYFRNGFGVAASAVDLARLPERLRVRLARGEVFNVMRDYSALGVNVEWHPLWTQTLTWIANWHDGSSLVQSELRFEPGNSTRLDLGVLDSLGSKGDEYGSIPLPGTPFTTGGGVQAYLRFVYFR